MTHPSLFFPPHIIIMMTFNEGFVEREIKNDGIPVNDLDEHSEAPAPREMIELESTFEKLEYELKEVIASRDELKKTFLDLTQLKCILEKAQIFFQQVRRENNNVKQLLPFKMFFLNSFFFLSSLTQCTLHLDLQLTGWDLESCF